MTTVDLAALGSLVGRTLGPGEPVPVTQDMIDRFADATGDDQWIHVDPERAAAGPFGTTIAHGYLTLALVPALTRTVLTVEGVGASINYGVNRVRFPTPAPVGSTLRATLAPQSVEQRGDSVQVVSTVTISADGAIKPCCVAEVVVLYFPAGPP